MPTADGFMMSEETPTPEPAAAPARLLVVDDEENIVLTISEVLRLEGYEVDVASSGREAVRQLDQEAEYDLILTDLHMDEGDGLSLLEEVRRRSPLTIVVVLTSGGLKDPGASRTWIPPVPAAGDDFDRVLTVLRESYGLALDR